MANSPQSSELFLLTEKVANLEKRLTVLESRVTASNDDDLEEFIKKSRYGYLGDDDSDPIESEPVSVKRGRRPRIPPDEHARRRDDLVHFVELRWPDLVKHLKRRKSIESLLQAVQAASPGAEHTWPYHQLIEHVGVLWEFLESGRYKGEPRQIAYAMAGVPEITWRSSLDYCTKNPSPLHITLPAFRDHIRRHRPPCLQSLLKDGITPENLKSLRNCCDECRRFAAKPERVVRALKEGEPLISGSSPRSLQRH